MVFTRPYNPAPTGAGATGGTQIVRRIIPKNDNMSLFGVDEEYSLSDSGAGGADQPPSSVFDTPIPARRPIKQTSYVFEKELREDFANPYCNDSSSEEEEEEDERGIMVAGEMGMSEESLTSHRTIGDSGYEDETGSVTGGFSQKQSICNKPSLVQMCFVKEDWAAQDLTHETARLSMNSQLSSFSSEDDGVPLVIQDRMTVEEVQGLSVQQLRSVTSLLHLEFTRINGELMGHLSDRDDLTELQDELLQKIFNLKNAKPTPMPCGEEEKMMTGKPEAKFSRRLSSFFQRH